YSQIDRRRLESRIRWYEAWEHLSGFRRPIAMYRFYHSELNVAASALRRVPDDWFRGYEERGIDMTSLQSHPVYRWDREILQLFDEHGTKRFSRLPLWDFDWNGAHAILYPEGPEKHIRDPRSMFERFVHRWLARTQPDVSHHADARYRRLLYYRVVER